MFFSKKTKKASLAEQVARTERVVRDLSHVNDSLVMSLQNMNRKEVVSSKRSR